ncbi:MAG TPA: hypothetical protein DHW39_09995 [Erysipelotrichaceae bacterium]|nr:hypothetical protein [Erysipelotrichaceae bacterium]
MSSIAYVTDEAMLEYHRLCRNRSILFWRLTEKKKFTDFRKGDLLFFFARPVRGRKKGFVGYAHYDSTKHLSLRQMWDLYKEKTGYDSEERMREAVMKAAKADIPEKMSCLYLTDVVFFLSPIYPEEVGLNISSKLESYCYLDRSDPKITADLMEKAEEHGIDLWSADSDAAPEIIFRNDAVRHKLAAIHREIGKETGSEKEKSACHRYAREKAAEEGWEMVRGSRCDCMQIMKDGSVRIAVPFAAQANDRELRIREFAGRLYIYRLLAEKAQLGKSIRFEVIGNNIPDVVKEITERINEEL